MPVAAPNSYLGRAGRPLYAGKPDPNYVPPAPGTSPGEPKFMRLYNWQFPSNPTFVGELEFDTRAQDLAFTDPKIASEIGTVRVMQSSQSIVHPMKPDVKRDRFLNPILDAGGNQIPLDISKDNFEFGATVFAIQGSLNDEVPGEIVYQCLVAMKPHGRWEGYPAALNFEVGIDNTYPAAFKIELLNAARQVIHTYQMRDGLAINDPRNPNRREEYIPTDPTSGFALRPWVNCAMMLPWQSARLKLSAHMKHWYPGFIESEFRAIDCKKEASTNAAIPQANGRTQSNSYLQWNALPRWPIAYDEVSGGTAVLNAQDPNTGDPFIDWTASTYGGGGRQALWTSGWDYEPGSVSGQDLLPAPGGVRFDRAPVPHTTALLVTFPNGARMKNNEPYRDMTHAWNLSYFNHSHHYIRNVKTFEMIPNSEIVNERGWSFNYAWFGTSTDYTFSNVPGKARHIDVWSFVNGGGDARRDKNGRYIYSGWTLDVQHNYCAPGWAVLVNNSPMHLVSAKLRWQASHMCALDAQDGSLFGFRQGAWRMHQYSQAWCWATNHPLGVTRAEIEKMFAEDLHDIHDNYYVAGLSPSASNVLKCFHRLGCGLRPGNSNDTERNADGSLIWNVLPTPLAFYLGPVLALMRRTGLFDVLHNRDEKCRIALEFAIECFDKWSCDFIVFTNGRCEEGGFSERRLTMPAPTIDQVEIPTSWEHWATLFPATGQESWIRKPDGTLVERYGVQHARANWSFIRRDYFPDINPGRMPRVLEACAKYQAFYDEYAATGYRWAWRFPSHLPMAPIQN